MPWQRIELRLDRGLSKNWKSAHDMILVINDMKYIEYLKYGSLCVDSIYFIVLVRIEISIDTHNSVIIFLSY